MAKRYTELSESHRAFIAQQQLFFVGTATADSRVNVSPKGMNSLQIIGANRVAWLNVTGSGNESAAHVQLFFVGTASADSRVNVSPKGMNSLQILGENRVAWLNVTGSGNESAAHVQLCPRMTIMFCAFAGEPLILRLYGNAQVIHHNDPEWQTLFPLFTPLPGARQIFDLTIDLVQTSCGMGVPYHTYDGEREQLNNWAIKKGEAGLQQYWIDKNQLTIDQLPTHIVERNI